VTTAATGAGGGGGGAQPVTAPSSSLAFTGASSGLGWVGVLGVVLIAAGLVMFVLVDGPRRVAFRMALIGPTGGLTPEMARRLERVQRPAQRVSRWLLGR